MPEMKYLDQEMYTLLDSPIYSLADAARLTGLSRYRVSRWLQGYKFTYEVAGGSEIRESHREAVVKRSREKDTFVSFLDLIDMLFVKSFLDNGFYLQTIRKALDEARERLMAPHFANSRFFTDGKNLYLELPKDSNHILALMTGGQWAIAPIVKKLSEKIDFHDVSGIATRWYPLGKDGRILVDPRICYGRPTIMGRGIATDNVYDLFLGENKNTQAVTDWFRITEIEAKSAVEFEHSMYA